MAEKEDIRVLLDLRNNKDLFTTYLNQQELVNLFLAIVIAIRTGLVE
ncbi:hypothetical protein [Paenibacillus sp. FSL K6-1318]